MARKAERSASVTGEAPQKIEIKDHSSLDAIASAMKSKRPIIIVTDDKDFNPLGYDRHSAEVWVGAVGGGLLMTLGGGALVLAFLDPEPTTKLGLLVGGGIMMALAGGGVIITILVTRSRYTSVMTYNKQTKKYEWVLQPR